MQNTAAIVIGRLYVCGGKVTVATSGSTVADLKAATGASQFTNCDRVWRQTVLPYLNGDPGIGPQFKDV